MDNVRPLTRIRVWDWVLSPQKAFLLFPSMVDICQKINSTTQGVETAAKKVLSIPSLSSILIVLKYFPIINIKKLLLYL